MLTRITVVICLFLSVTCVHAQNNTKSAFKQFKKGNLEKANELLSEIESKGEQSLPYYYVKTLCILENASTPEDYKRVLYFILKSDPRSIVDSKEIKSLNKTYGLNDETYDELLTSFYRQVFLVYKSLNTAELWMDHNAAFASSTQLDSAFLNEANSVYQEIEPTLEAYSSFCSKYKAGKYTEGIVSEAYQKLVNLEFLRVEEEGDPELLFDFAYRYQSESHFKPLVEQAFSKAVSLDNDSKRLLKFAVKLNGMGFDNLVSDARSKAFNLDYSLIKTEIDSGSLQISSVKKFILNYPNQTAHCNAIRDHLDSLTFLRLTTNFTTENYAAYVSTFPSSNIKGSLDSLLNMYLYRYMMDDNLLAARDIHERFNRPESSYGYDLIQGLIENQKLSYVPALNKYDSYSFIRIEDQSKTLTNIDGFKAEVILRDGYSFFRFKDSEGWGAVQIDKNGKVKELFRCDEVSALTNNLYLTKSEDVYSVIATNGEVLVTSDTTRPIILPSGNILVTGNESVIIDTWNKSKVEIDQFLSALNEYCLLARSGMSSNEIIALYDMYGKKLISGQKIEVERTIGNVQNLLVDGKRYVLHEDSIFKNPVNEYLVFYQDAQNMIYASRDGSYNGGIFTIIKDNTKETLTARGSYLSENVIDFNTDDGPQIYGLNSLTKIPLASIKNSRVVNGDVLVQSEFGFITLYKQSDSGWFAPVTLSTANGFYQFNEDEYGYDEDYGSDPFNVSDNDVNTYSTANGIEFDVSNFDAPSVYAVVINDYLEYVNDQGKVVGPNYFSYAENFDAPYAQAYGSRDESIIINSYGDVKMYGYLKQWVSPNQFIFTNGNKYYEYNIRTKYTKEICSDCSVLKKIEEDLYEIEVDGKIAYLQTTNSGKFLGAYLSSEDHMLRAHLSRLRDYWLDDSYRTSDYYKYHLEEIKVSEEVNKYLLAKVKFKLALDLEKDMVSEVVAELENFDNEYFSDEERAEIYYSLALSFYNSRDYQKAILYYGLLSTIKPEEFNSKYAFRIAQCYAAIKDYNNAEKYYKAWGETEVEPYHYIRIADMYGEAGYSSLAIEYYKKYATIGESEQAKAMETVGLIYFKDRNYSHAISSWKQCVPYYQERNMDYKLGELYYNIASAYANSDMTSSACKYYNLAVQNGRSLPYWYNYNCK